MLAPLLAGAIVSAYVASLWWLLRRESANTLLALLALCGLSLCLRLVHTGDFPAGLHDDEPKILGCVLAQMHVGELFGEDCTGLPVFLNGLFQAQLVPVFGPGRWAIRFYSMVTGVLATPAAFAAARALGMRTAASLTAASLLAVLPWSLFWSRISMGGELPFHQLLLLAALARLVKGTGRWAEVGIGGLGLGLLLYDYWSGRAMLGMPILAALLARGHRRGLCLAVLGLALAGWSPYISGNPMHGLNAGAALLDPGLAPWPFATLYRNVTRAAAAFVTPSATNGALTIAAAAMHPPLILAFALLGVLNGVRRGVFLGGGFLGAMTPALLSGGVAVSAHRMIMAYPFVALAAASGLDLVPGRRTRPWLAAVVAVVAAAQSVTLFFSDEFWPAEGRWNFNQQRTALIDALPAPPRPHLILDQALKSFYLPRAQVESDYDWLSVKNWVPANGQATIYAFSIFSAPLRPFYENLFGFERIETFGSAFLLELEAADWSWLRRHGWVYEARCGEEPLWSENHGGLRRAIVPVLYQAELSFPDLRCPQRRSDMLTHCASIPSSSRLIHTWRGRWLGPRATLQLRFSGTAVVDDGHGVVLRREGREQTGEFAVDPGADITVTVATPRGLWTALMEVTPAGPRLPVWERVGPDSSGDSIRGREDASCEECCEECGGV